MRRLFSKIIIITVLFLASPLHADQNEEVAQWVKQITTQTFSVNYTQHQSDFAYIRSHYTNNAWNAITSFLGNYLNIIQTHRITVHPIFADEPRVVKTGYYSGIHYWRVNQIITLPELKVAIAFSIVVIARNTTTGDPYLIQSMDINKKDY